MNTNNETQEVTSSDVETVDAAGTLSDPGVPEVPAPNDAQAKAAEILAARGKGKEAKVAKEPKAVKESKEPAEVKAPKPEGLVKTGYKFLREIDPAIDKLNTQQKIIVDEMLKLVDNTEGSATNGVVLREPLIKALQESSMVTRQPHERVFGFYLNGWKKSFEATEKKPAIPALLEVVKVTFKN